MKNAKQLFLAATVISTILSTTILCSETPTTSQKTSTIQQIKIDGELLIAGSLGTLSLAAALGGSHSLKNIRRLEQAKNNILSSDLNKGIRNNRIGMIFSLGTIGYSMVSVASSIRTIEPELAQRRTEMRLAEEGLHVTGEAIDVVEKIKEKLS